MDFRHGPDPVRTGERLSTDPPPPLVADTLAQLVAYFAGHLREFDVPLDLGALTPFQLDVYRVLDDVSFGKITTYGALSEELGLGPSGARAVGQAVGANPAAIIVPCHRVIGSDHTLHGYSGGLPRKAWLLRHEGIVVDGDDEHSRVHPEELRLEL